MSATVYVESSVISYLTSRPSRDLITAANQQVTQEWWTEKRQEFELFISQLVVQECSTGDSEAADRRKQSLQDLKLLTLSDEAAALAQRLLQQGAVPSVAVEDALHIAIATTHGMDYLLTWNFKHIANATMRANIDAICRQAGYEPPVICSPYELMEV